MKNMKFKTLGLAALLIAGCIDENSGPQGLHETEPSGGARIVFDLDARPLPEVPFPNDVATRVDPTSPTGRRVNVSALAPTDLEARVRAKANQLDGFGTFAPITVQFTKALDVKNIAERHIENVPDLSNDAVFVVNIDPKSPEYGKLEVLDMGLGNFPATMKSPEKYFDFDPRAHGSNFLFESEREEDLNGNGVLDPYEDTDDDGVWDVPNTMDPDGDPREWRQLLDFYERESNTLIIHTLDTLRPGTTYAVVLTDALVDEDGKPVDSPFEFINHTRQTPDLERLRDALPRVLPERFDESLKSVRFAWSFTTQSSTLDMETIREGLYGSGPMAWLDDQYPAELKLTHQIRGEVPEGESPMVNPLAPTIMQLVIDALAGGISDLAKQSFVNSYGNVDYMVSGSFITPYFLVDKDGLPATPEDIANNRNQYDEDESFSVNPGTGEAIVGYDEVTWWCAIPKTTETRKPPFPVAMYGHGYGSARQDTLGFAGAMAKFGIASCGLDAAGHGVVLPDDIRNNPLFETVLESQNMQNLLKVLEHGRVRDLNNDGVGESGGDFWTADIFHTRDILRQSVVDHMQFVRILRTFDGTRRWPDAIDESDPFVIAQRDIVAGWDANGDGKGEIAGDFNGDGIPDLGGEQPYYAWGTSLGGILSPLIGGIDPAVRAAAPVSGGAGLLDIGHRSTQGGVPEAVILPMLGPIVIGRPDTDWNDETEAWEPNGTLNLEWLVTSVADEVYIPFARVEGVEEGDRVVVRNLKREERAHLVKADKLQARSVIRNGAFRAGLAADAMNANEKRHALGFDPTFSSGLAYRRTGSPENGWHTALYKQGRAGNYPTIEETQTAIDFSYAEGDTPGDTFNPARWAGRWEGVLVPEEDGAYEFHFNVDGLVQFYVNNVREVSERNGEFNERVRVEAGVPVMLRIDYTHEGGDAALKVEWTPPGGARQAIPADAIQTHLRLSSDEEVEYQKHFITSKGGDARDFGDGFVIEIWDAEGTTLKKTVDTFEIDAIYENVVYPAGSPLAAPREGFGQQRQTPDMRRFLGLAQHLVDAGDPAVYGPTYWRYPLQFPYEKNPNFRTGETNMLFIPTAGDSAVPVATGYAMARVGGVLDYRREDSRYGMTANQYLIETYSYEGVYWLDRFEDYPQALFDHDDLDRGKFTTDKFPERGFDPNPDATRPLRATLQTSRGVSAMRVPYHSTSGNHSIFLSEPTYTFDIDAFMANQISHYFANGGEALSDDPCMEDYTMESCPWFDPETYDPPDIQ